MGGKYHAESFKPFAESNDGGINYGSTPGKF
jgi:hypothetical protein